MAVDRQPPNWDPSVHLATALDYKEAIQEGRWVDLLLAKTRRGHQQYPPLYHFSLMPLLSYPNPQENVVWLNLIYLAIMTAAASWMAYRIGGLWPAAATMIAVALSPRVFHTYREVFVDIGLAAWVVAAYAAIIKSDFYADRRWAWAVGLFAGLAQLSKFDAFVYLLPGICAGLFGAKNRKNLARAIGLAALVAGPWYLANAVDMIPRLWVAFTLGHKQGNPQTWTMGNWTYYLHFLKLAYSMPLLALMTAGAVISLAASLRRRDKSSKPKWLLATWAAFAYLFCTLTPSKDYRYFFDVLPVVPILGFSGLPAPVLGVSAALATYNLADIRQPDPGDWHLHDVLQTIRERKKPGPADLCLLTNHRNFNTLTLEWTARHEGFSDIYIACQQTEIPEWADFVLLKTADMGSFMGERTLEIAAAAQENRGLFAKVFRKAGNWDLPDGSKLVLFELRPGVQRLAEKRHILELQIKTARLNDVDITPTGPGRYAIKVGSLVLAKMPAPIRDIRINISDAELIEDHGRFYVLHIGEVELASARLKWTELSAALTARSRLPISIEKTPSGLRALARLPALPLELWLDFHIAPKDIEVAVSRAKVAGIKVPFLAGSAWRRSLAPAPPYQPYRLKISEMKFNDQELSIGI